MAITSIQPPEDIAQPVQQREVAKQKLAQFQREKLQQLSEAKLKVEVVLAEQKKRVVEAEQEVVEKTTKAEQEQQVAVTLAEQKLKVAQTQLEAAKDKASAILAKAEADAEVIKFDNAAEAAGLAARSRRSTATARPWPVTCFWARSPRRSARSWATRKARSWTCSASSPSGASRNVRCPSARLSPRPEAVPASTPIPAAAPVADRLGQSSSRPNRTPVATSEEKRK